MPTEIYIYSKVYSPALVSEGRGGLEDDLQDFMGEAGEVTGGGGGERGWNVDLELTVDAGVWIERICGFLRQWGVAEDTYLCIYPEGWVEGTEPGEIRVFDA